MKHFSLKTLAKVLLTVIFILSFDVAAEAVDTTFVRRRKPLPVPFGLAPKAPGQGCRITHEKVPVEMLEEDGIARENSPITFGFPFPEGVLFDPEMVRVLDPRGREIPSQYSITCLWPDGSIKWLLLDFSIVVPPKEKVIYYVEYGNLVRRRAYTTPLKIKDNNGIITIETGVMRSVINRKSFNLLDKVLLDLNQDGTIADDEILLTMAQGGIVLTDSEGKLFTSAKGEPVDIRIEEEGPLKITLRIDGKYWDTAGKSFSRFITRMNFFANSAIVRIAHTHIDDRTEQEFTDFRSVQFSMSFHRGDARKAIYFTSPLESVSCPVQTNEKAITTRLLQKDDASYQLSGACNVNGKRAPGMVDYTNSQGYGVSVAIADFWQTFPKGISSSDNALKIELFPDLRGQDYYKSLPPHLGFFMHGGRYRFKVGMSQTSRLSYFFHGPQKTDKPAFVSKMQDSVNPIIPVVPSSWYARTLAMGTVVEKSRGSFEAYDEAFEFSFRAYIAHKEKVREYGLFNWGDWYGERERNWGNNEYDYPHSLIKQFLRTGNRDYFRMAMAGARHMGDVDSVHAHSQPERVGAMHLHAFNHTGTWSEIDKLPSWSSPYGWETWAANGHTWAEGMIEAWWLSGDARVMETAQELGDHIAYGMAPRFKELTDHERSAGWALVAIMALYRATNDPIYLDAARKIANVAITSQKDDSRGPWPHPLPGYHCGLSGNTPGCIGDVSWLIGILGCGLVSYHAETGDEQVQNSIEKLVAWLVTQWVTRDYSFTTSSSSFYRGIGMKGATGHALVPIAYVWERSRNEQLLEMVAEGFITDTLKIASGSGERTASLSRWMPELMWCLSTNAQNPLADRAIRKSLKELRALRANR